MVKALEQLDLWALRDLLTSQHGRLLAWLPRRTARRHWTRQVWTRIGTRSEAAAVAADHTPAIYMPNRAHRARVAVKKLRYAIEVAADMQIWRPGVILKDLRRLQDTLGEVHDLQVLVDSLDGLTPEEQRGTSHSSPMRVLLEDDIARRYAEYIKRRDRIGRIAEACARAARSPRWRLPVPLVVASAFTAPLVIESIRPWRPEKASELHD
jgi:CHAD domain-containing protein